MVDRDREREREREREEREEGKEGEGFYGVREIRQNDIMAAGRKE